MAVDWHKFFIVFGLSILGGIWLSPVLPSSFSFSFLFFIIALSLYLIGKGRERKTIFVFSTIIFAGVFVGTARVTLDQDFRHELDGYLRQKVEIAGEVVSQPDERAEMTRFIIKPKNFQAKILVTTERFPRWQNGDKVKLQGKLSVPSSAIGEATATSTPFDYAAYLSKDGVYYEMYRPVISLGSRPTFGFTPFVNTFRGRLLSTMNTLLPEPESSLLAGILLGARQGLDKQVADDFTKAGVSHILVLSGFNITVVANYLLTLCSYFPRLVGGFAGILGIILFGLIAGGGSVVWRSVLMAVIAWYARLSGRLFDVSAALLVTALVITVWNPVVLSADLGFELSLFAMAGIVYVSPMIEEKYLGRITKKFGLREMMATTFGAQFAVLPLLWLATGRLSLVGFVSNLVVLHLVPPIMFLGGIILALGFILPVLAWPVAPLGYLLLRTLVVITHWFASWPLANLSIGASNFVVITVYLLLTGMTIKYWCTKMSLLKEPSTA